MFLGDDIAWPGFELGAELTAHAPCSKVLREQAAFWIGAMYLQFS